MEPRCEMDFALSSIAIAVGAPSRLLADGITPSQISMMVVIAGLSALMLILTRRRVRRGQNSPRAYAREQIARLRQEREVQHQVQGVMVELNQLSRQINAQVDTRYAKLQAVIRHADERIDVLTRLVHAADGTPTIDVTVGDEANAPTPPAEEEDRARSHILALADAGRSAAEIARDVDKTPGEVELILALRQPPATGLAKS